MKFYVRQRVTTTVVYVVEAPSEQSAIAQVTNGQVPADHDYDGHVEWINATPIIDSRLQAPN